MAVPLESVPAVPSGFSEPLSTVTELNHSAWIWIVSLFVVSVISFFLILRVYIRTGPNPPFSRDDIVLSTATIFALIYIAVLLSGTSHGFGISKDLLDENVLIRIQKEIYASDLLFITSLWLSKCSVVLTFIRLRPAKHFVRALYVLLGFSVIWAVVSFFVLALRCDLANPWIQYGPQCRNLFLRWQLTIAFDIIVEICLFAAVILLVMGLQMPWHKKATVMFIFGSRLPVIAFAGIRIPDIRNGILSDDPNLDGVPAVIWALVELCYSIVAATVPCLNSFLRAVNTNMGALGPESVLEGSQLQSFNDHKLKGASPHNTYELKSTSSNNNKDFAQQSASGSPSDVLQLPRGDGAQGITTITHEGAESIESNDSTRMIIKKDVEWSVQGTSRSNAAPW